MSFFLLESVGKEKKEVEDKSGKMRQLLLKQKKELEELRHSVSQSIVCSSCHLHFRQLCIHHMCGVVAPNLYTQHLCGVVEEQKYGPSKFTRFGVIVFGMVQKERPKKSLTLFISILARFKKWYFCDIS